MAGTAGVYGSLRPSGADFGAIAERGVERLLREKRLDEKERADIVKQIRSERTARDKFVNDVLSQENTLKQSEYWSGQIYDLREEYTNGLLKLTDELEASNNSYPVRKKIKAYTDRYNNMAMQIGQFSKSIEELYGKFTSVKNGKPEYSPDLNAGKQTLLGNLTMGGGDYEVDLKTFTVTGPEGAMNAQDFFNKNLKDLEAYVDPDESVKDFFSEIPMGSKFNKKEESYIGKDGNERTLTTYSAPYQQYYDELYEPFARTFSPNNPAWRQYASETDMEDVPDDKVTEHMFKNALVMSGLTIETTADVIETESSSVATKAKKKKASLEWLADIASGGDETGGVSILKSGNQDVERTYNPKTGKVGLVVYKEGEEPRVIDDISTSAGAAEALEMAARGRTGLYARYDEFEVSADEFSDLINTSTENMTPASKKKMTKAAYRKGARTAVSESLETLGGFTLDRKAKRKYSPKMVENWIEELKEVVPNEIMDKVDPLIGIRKNGTLYIGDQEFTKFSEDTREEIVNAIVTLIEGTKKTAY